MAVRRRRGRVPVVRRLLPVRGRLPASPVERALVVLHPLPMHALHTVHPVHVHWRLLLRGGGGLRRGAWDGDLDSGVDERGDPGLHGSEAVADVEGADVDVEEVGHLVRVGEDALDLGRVGAQLILEPVGVEPVVEIGWAEDGIALFLCE
jgi:hypothetical protein